MSPRDKPLVWLRGEVKSPPFSAEARVEAGFLLRRLQHGEAPAVIADCKRRLQWYLRLTPKKGGAFRAQK